MRFSSTRRKIYEYTDHQKRIVSLIIHAILTAIRERASSARGNRACPLYLAGSRSLWALSVLARYVYVLMDFHVLPRRQHMLSKWERPCNFGLRGIGPSHRQIQLQRSICTWCLIFQICSILMNHTSTMLRGRRVHRMS